MANYNKRNKIDANKPACVINVCCDKVVMLPMPLKDIGNKVLVSEWLKYFDRKLYASDFDG